MADWAQLTHDQAIGLKGTQVLIVRGDGKGHYGTIVDVTLDWVELANGKQSQYVHFLGGAYSIAPVTLPTRRIPQLGHPKLALEN